MGPCQKLTVPLPKHVLHSYDLVPGLHLEPLHVPHVSSTLKLTVFVTPYMASQKESSNYMITSSPLIGLFDFFQCSPNIFSKLPKTDSKPAL